MLPDEGQILPRIASQRVSARLPLRPGRQYPICPAQVGQVDPDSAQQLGHEGLPTHAR